MSRPLPRRSRHHHNPSEDGGGRRRAPQAAGATESNLEEGYDNDAGSRIYEDPNGAGLGEADGQANTLTETLTDMNLKVLQQYEPSIRTILSVAASTVVYVLNYETGGWEKPEPQVEGTLFLCEQEPLVVGEFVLPRACVFVLNRKGLSNVVVDLSRVNVAEVTTDLITLRVHGGGGNDDSSGNGGPQGPAQARQQPVVLGFWIHGGTANAASTFDPIVVLQCWQMVRSALELTLGTAETVETGPVLETAATAAALEMAAIGEDPLGKATRAIGRRPNINELAATALGTAVGGTSAAVG